MQTIPDGRENLTQGEEEAAPLVLRLVDLRSYRLSPDGPNVREASDAAFLEFASSIVEVRGEGLGCWTVEERRDFLNWCFERGVLEVGEGGVLQRRANQG